jgi:hypothetical protein
MSTARRWLGRLDSNQGMPESKSYNLGRQIRREHLLWPSVSKIPLLSVRQNPTYTAVLTISGADMVPT